MSRERFRLRSLPSGDGRADLAREVQAGLARRPKSLPCRFFYDERGSALFDEICAQPEYYVWRAEDEILAAHAEQIVSAVPAEAVLVELGSGSATKTKRLLAAHAARGSALCYATVDISSGAIQQSAERLLAAFPRLEVDAVCAEYEPGLAQLAREKRAPWLVLWLGSNIGNLERGSAAQFLRSVAAHLGGPDRLLVGIDRRKDARVLEAAYDDAQGVTARFNANLLARVNAELSADFDLRAFRHVARYDEREGRVEMHLESLRRQTIRIAALGLEVGFEEGERIHTEDSLKYSDAEIEALARAAGLRIERSFTDREARFRCVLLAPA